MEVKEEEDGTLTITWDKNDPVERVFNDWTEQDFIDVITSAAQRILDQHQQEENI